MSLPGAPDRPATGLPAGPAGPHSARMDARDLDLRNRTYQLVVALGRVPSAEELATSCGLPVQRVRDGWRRLHAEHAVVLDASGTQLRMANPFSAVPTAYRVSARGRWWYANCAWDAVGVCAALHCAGRIESSCLDCGEPLAVQVQPGQAPVEPWVFHCLVPAARWWDDIAFT